MAPSSFLLVATFSSDHDCITDKSLAGRCRIAIPDIDVDVAWPMTVEYAIMGLKLDLS